MISIKILVQRRKPGVQAGGRGGWIWQGLETLAPLTDYPDTPWYDWLLHHYGEGEYHVTTNGPDGRIMLLFHQTVTEDSGGGFTD